MRWRQHHPLLPFSFEDRRKPDQGHITTQAFFATIFQARRVFSSVTSYSFPYSLSSSWPNENGERNALIMREEEESSTMGEGEDSTASRHLPYRDRSVRHSRPPSSMCVCEEASSGSSISTWAWNLPRLKIFFKAKFYFNGVQTRILRNLSGHFQTVESCTVVPIFLRCLSALPPSFGRPPELRWAEGKEKGD